jgi:hypothetical protein
MSGKKWGNFNVAWNGPSRFTFLYILDYLVSNYGVFVIDILLDLLVGLLFIILCGFLGALAIGSNIPIIVFGIGISFSVCWMLGHLIRCLWDN